MKWVLNLLLLQKCVKKVYFRWVGLGEYCCILKVMGKEKIKTEKGLREKGKAQERYLPMKNCIQTEKRDRQIFGKFPLNQAKDLRKERA